MFRGSFLGTFIYVHGQEVKLIVACYCSFDTVYKSCEVLWYTYIGSLYMIVCMLFVIIN